MYITQQQRRDTAANWTAINPILFAGEIGYETDTGKAKIGDGVTHWTSLVYFDPAASGVSIAAETARAEAAEALLAPKASPVFTGTPTAPTASPGDNTTKLATTAFVLANVPAGLALDTNAAHFVPDGTASAGVQTVAAASDHVHPEKAWQSRLLMPSGAIAETYPRLFAGGQPALSTGQTYVTAIVLEKGITVTNITYITGTGGETGGTHGWCGLLDNTGKVLAVSIDQTGATVWSPGASKITIAMTTPYVVTTTGVYYTALSITASGMPNIVGVNSLSNTSAVSQSPILTATGGTNNTPPAVGTILTLTANASSLYGYVS